MAHALNSLLRAGGVYTCLRVKFAEREVFPTYGGGAAGAGRSAGSRAAERTAARRPGAPVSDGGAARLGASLSLLCGLEQLGVAVHKAAGMGAHKARGRHDAVLVGGEEELVEVLLAV